MTVHRGGRRLGAVAVGPAAPSAPQDRRLEFLVIGDNGLAGRVCALLERPSVGVTHLLRPDDAALGAAAALRPRAVAIALHDDVSALRYALAIAHLQPETRIVVTIFDRTIAARLRELLPRVTVTSSADVAAPILAAACLASSDSTATGPSCPESEPAPSDGAAASARPGGRRRRSIRSPGSPRSLHDLLGRFLPVSRTHDSHTQLLFVGTAGLAVVLVSDWAWLILLDHRPAVPTALDAARVVATVGPGPAETSAAYAAFSSTAILVTVVLTAMFTAGLVQRLLEPGLLGFVGKRRAPRSGHVVVVGMGQVGVRLCAELRRLGVPVVGVERTPTAPQLRLARALKIPVVVGHGVDRAGLERLRLNRSLALAAVGSNELDNIAVAVAASAVSPRTRVVLRAGEQEAIAETRSMLPLGTTTDVLRLTASAMTQAMCSGAPSLDPAPHETTAAPERRDCIHLG